MKPICEIASVLLERRLHYRDSIIRQRLKFSQNAIDLLDEQLDAFSATEDFHERPVPLDQVFMELS